MTPPPTRFVSAARASPPPPLRVGDLRLAILVDFDGTVALTDVSDTIMAAHIPGQWEEIVERYDAGLLGSRELMAWEISLLRADPELLLKQVE